MDARENLPLIFDAVFNEEAEVTGFYMQYAIEYFYHYSGKSGATIAFGPSM